MTASATATDLRDGFAARLRLTTRPDHAQAEGGEFFAALKDGSFSVADHIALTTAHLPIYRALEAATDRHQDSPLMGPFVDRRLYRRDRLAADLVSCGVAEPLTPVPAATRYAEHIDDVSTDPVKVLAHHYTRYLGDLSGGQYLHRRMTVVLPTLAMACRFYDFSELGDLTLFKDAYRARLDVAPLTAADQQIFIDEVRGAYRFNVEMMIDLHHARPTDR